jgi:hypothetical protein
MSRLFLSRSIFTFRMATPLRRMAWVRSGLQGHVGTLMQSRSGSRVLASSMRSLTAPNAQFIVDEVCASIHLCAGDRYGAAVLLAISAHAEAPQLVQLVYAVVAARIAVRLAKDAHGNYALQQLLSRSLLCYDAAMAEPSNEHAAVIQSTVPLHVIPLLDTIMVHFAELARHKHSSNAMQAVVKCAARLAPDRLASLLETILLMDRWGAGPALSSPISPASQPASSPARRCARDAECEVCDAGCRMHVLRCVRVRVRVRVCETAWRMCSKGSWRRCACIRSPTT